MHLKYMLSPNILPITTLQHSWSSCHTRYNIARINLPDSITQVAEAIGMLNKCYSAQTSYLPSPASHPYHGKNFQWKLS